MCSESNHLSPNDFFPLLAYGILRIYTAYCLMNHHPRMQSHPKVSLASVIRMKCYSILSIQAKQWVQLFLSIKEKGHQKKNVTPNMHAMVYHVPNIITPIRKFETIFMSRLVMHSTSFLIVIYALQVLRYIDAKKNYFSSNRWDAPADIMMTEYRLEVLQEYSREKSRWSPLELLS